MVIGKGSVNAVLTEEDVFGICEEAFSQQKLDGKRVLALIPDLTRTAPIDMMFRVVYQLLADRVENLDFLVALGTHQPLSEDRINKLVGITAEERSTKYSKARFFNHHWDDPAQLRSVGIISEDDMAEISNGLLQEKVDVTINKMVFDYDVLMVIGPTFPHEVVGFSGGLSRPKPKETAPRRHAGRQSMHKLHSACSVLSPQPPMAPIRHSFRHLLHSVQSAPTTRRPNGEAQPTTVSNAPVGQMYRQ